MIKKIIAREFLWFLAALVVAIPLSIAIFGSFDLLEAQNILTPKEKIYITEFFISIYIVSFGLVYIFRLTILAVQSLTAKEVPESN
ncbi:MAG: hypothetical protein AAF705_20600 [Bacteroidota bacterium]